jgi:predicted GTPase
MYDITSENALKSLDKYRVAMFSNSERVCQAVVLVGNKCDSINKRKILTRHGRTLSHDFMMDYGVPFFEISALHGHNV